MDSEFDTSTPAISFAIQNMSQAQLALGGVSLVALSKKLTWALNEYHLAGMLAQTPTGYLQRGIEYAHLGDYQRAITDFNQAIKLNPKSAEAYYERGEVYFLLNNYRRAIKDFTRVLKLNPSAMIYNKRGLAYQMLDEYQRAIRDHNRALAIDPNETETYRWRGQAYRLLKAYQRAIADFNHALEIDPALAWAYAQRGETYSRQNNYEQALGDINFALKLDPDYAWAYSCRGAIYLAQGDLKHAKADFARNQELDQSNVSSDYIVEWIRICEEQFDPTMVERLEEMAVSNPRSYDSIICRGMAAWLNEKYEKALEELGQASLLEPEAYEPLFWKGMTYACLRQDQEAQDAFEQALALGLPPVLLSPLRWLEQKHPEFFHQYVQSLFARLEGENDIHAD